MARVHVLQSGSEYRSVLRFYAANPRLVLPLPRCSLSAQQAGNRKKESAKCLESIPNDYFRFRGFGRDYPTLIRAADRAKTLCLKAAT
ncbi:MAG TPA: hypothetical protein VHS80_04495, partial [Chthoniobacterales bacterium]|nr:hypothetical protein [Chthoniobacterales bacterium]